MKYSCFLLLLLSFGAKSQDTLTLGEVFDFDIGDEFHYDIFGASPIYLGKWVYIEDKSFSSQGDTVFYETREFIYNYDSFDGSWSSKSFFVSNLDSLVNWEFECPVPFPFPTGTCTLEYSFDSLCNRRTFSMTREIIWEGNTEEFKTEHFGVGVGYVELVDSTFTGDRNRENLVYYQKLNDVCGTPRDLPIISSDLNQRTSEINVYPNPILNYLVIDFENLNGGEAEIEILSITGALVYREKSYLLGSKLNFHNWSKGVYVVRIKHDSTIYYKKIMVQ